MRKTSVRDISAFVIILGSAIYALRPSSPKSAVLDLQPVLSKPLDRSSAVTEKMNFAKESKRPPRLPSSAKTDKVGSQAASSKPNTLTERDQRIADLRALKKCYVSETCPFPQTDPRSYSFAVGRKISQDLAKFGSDFAKSSPAEARALALEFADNEDGFVQEAVLDVLSQVPPAGDSLKAAARTISETTSPSIVTQAMDELRRYVGTQNEPEVHAALVNVLSTGGVLTSQKASQGLLPFLNPRSVGYYQKVLKTLAPDSEVARNLKISLLEYQRISTGG